MTAGRDPAGTGAVMHGDVDLAGAAATAGTAGAAGICVGNFVDTSVANFVRSVASIVGNIARIGGAGVKEGPHSRAVDFMAVGRLRARPLLRPCCVELPCAAGNRWKQRRTFCNIRNMEKDPAQS